MADREIFNQKNVYLSRHLKSLKGITFGCLNVCSIIRKLEDVHTILCNSELNYLGITESWLNTSIANCEIELPGYELHRYDHDLGSGKHGGWYRCIHCHKQNF